MKREAEEGNLAGEGGAGRRRRRKRRGRELLAGDWQAKMLS